MNDETANLVERNGAISVGGSGLSEWNGAPRVAHPKVTSFDG